MTAADPVEARRGGRPSREAAGQLGEKILEVATEFFLRDGYGSTSIEAVAKAAGVSKRTFYHRFEGKPALFGAVVQHVVGHIRPPPDVPLVAGATPAEILQRLAGLMLDAALLPEALALSRLILAEATRFPAMAEAVAGRDSSQEAIDLIAGILRSHADGRSLSPGDAAFAARQFIQLVVAWPQRLAFSGSPPLSRNERNDWVARTTRLFLDGCWALGSRPCDP